MLACDCIKRASYAEFRENPLNSEHELGYQNGIEMIAFQYKYQLPLIKYSRFLLYRQTRSISPIFSIRLPT